MEDEDIMYCTEAEVKEILLELTGDIDKAPTVFVAFREQVKNRLQRLVTFVIQTNEGNEELVNRIVKFSSENNMRLRFSKSDINVQSGNLTVDYLYIEAIIQPKLT